MVNQQSGICLPVFTIYFHIKYHICCFTIVCAYVYIYNDIDIYIFTYIYIWIRNQKLSLKKTASTKCLVCTWCWLVAHRSLKECQEPRTTLAVETPYQQLGRPHFWVRQPFARAAPSTGWLSGSQVGLFCNCWSQTEGVLIQRIHVNIT